MALDRKKRATLRSRGQTLQASMHIGKDGVTDAVIDELSAQLKRNDLVKVRLLPAATDGGARDEDAATAIAARCGAELIERRGHTVLLYRGPA